MDSCVLKLPPALFLITSISKLGAYILNYTTNENVILTLEQFGPQIKTEFLKQTRSGILFLSQQRIVLLSV